MNRTLDLASRAWLAAFAQRYALLLGIALVALLADQTTKRIVEANLALYESIPFIGHYLSWTHVQNTGAAFSLFPNGGALFVVIAVVVAAVIVYYAPRLPTNDWFSRIALGLQLGGALGNLVDRLRQGYVTDFIHFQIPEIGFDWPVFNIADSCIVVGTLALIIVNLWRERRARNSTAA
ncbi:MAG: signal peptidase II [Thermoflexales bacterium]|nr:signal peptidase II [Thermoflexales bacterium]MCS7325329.1 signal peptidase II [Thermoflexales bacterium]MDW8054611.1 signal peptidase II [Anaerolineae bacterium]MDW8292945.1 signal peptidase II [Anaerolineae bacterium]